MANTDFTGRSWPVVDFKNANGTLHRKSGVKDGQPFCFLQFGATLVNFSTNLGKVSGSYIAEHKDELQVTEMVNKDTSETFFVLCKAGDLNDEIIDL